MYLTLVKPSTYWRRNRSLRSWQCVIKQKYVFPRHNPILSSLEALDVFLNSRKWIWHLSLKLQYFTFPKVKFFIVLSLILDQTKKNLLCNQSQWCFNLPCRYIKISFCLQNIMMINFSGFKGNHFRGNFCI